MVLGCQFHVESASFRAEFSFKEVTITGALPPLVSDFGLSSNSAGACHSEPEARAQTPRLAVRRSFEAAVVYRGALLPGVTGSKHSGTL